MTRVITGAMGILILVPICIFSHTFIWPLILTVFTWFAAHEMLLCSGNAKEKVLVIPSYLFSAMPMVIWLLSVRTDLVENVFQVIFLWTALYVFSVQIAACLVSNRIPSERLYSCISLTCYAVVGMTSIFLIRYVDSGCEEGKYIYLLVFFGGWISDTFAYFSGRMFGKHLLAPSISPKKTVEGSIGAIVANMICFAGYALVLRECFDFPASIPFFAILGALFSAIGQFGDLFASCIKRHYGIKDFGSLFPGHGGVLDRFDSTIAIAIVMMFLEASFGTAFLIS